MKQQFRKIFVVESKGNFEALGEHTDTVIFLSTGLERVEDLPQKVLEAFEEGDFDPSTDAVVTVGRTNANFLAGLIIGRMFPPPVEMEDINVCRVTMGIFNPTLGKERGEWYEWLEV